MDEALRASDEPWLRAHRGQQRPDGAHERGTPTKKRKKKQMKSRRGTEGLPVMVEPPAHLLKLRKAEGREEEDAEIGNKATIVTGRRI
jgi:hypothetical protein